MPHALKFQVRQQTAAWLRLRQRNGLPVLVTSGICKIRCIVGFTKLGQRFPQYVLCMTWQMSSMPTRACTASVTYHRAVVVPVNETVVPTYFKAAALKADQLLLAQAAFLRAPIL
jgi:hypothetical protein